MTTKIRIAKHTDEIAICMRLRWAVFVEEQTVTEADEIDGEDISCTHVLAEGDGKPTGAARFRLIDDKVKIQRVCVLSAERRNNIGADIIRFIVKQANETTDAKFVCLGAQVHAIDFYRKLGFREMGEEYLDAGIAHIDMWLDLSV